MIKNRSFGQKLIFFTTGMLFIASIVIGMFSYTVARNSLIEKGKISLKNGVKSALILIDDMNKDVQNGSVTLEAAQENLKLYLMGPMNPDGTRVNQPPVDFGENGYYIIYSLTGVEIMHPTLEGQNVWAFKDKGSRSNPFYLVQDKIEKAQLGGGFTEYTWEYPYSSELGRKIVYSELDPNWNWVVTAGSYISDFDNAASDILKITLVTMVAVIVLGFLFARQYIHSITQPITMVVNAMKYAEEGVYLAVPQSEVFDELGKLTHGFNTMIRAIDTAQKKLLQKDDQLLQYAYYDDLSGLPNANFFEKYVSERIAAISSNAAMMLIDIKDFNAINSIYGVAYGDKIIAFLGQKAVEIKTESAFIARIGGNAFALWIENYDAHHIDGVVAQAINKIKLDLQAAEFISHIDFYGSLVVYDPNDTTFEQIYKKASTALQYAKNNKLTDVIMYKDTMYTVLEREAKLLTLAEQAIKADEFVIYYQEKVDANTKSVTGVESLSRWFSPELGLVNPNEFIPVLYKSNLMVQFTHYMLAKVVDDLAKLQSLYGKDITVSVNISPVSFFNDSFVVFLTSLVKRRGINASTIVLEITEDVFISDFENVKARISVLKALGFKISLDDFGTGYSSLNYLSKIKFDEIKVDKSFIDQVHLDETSYALFRAIVKIAKSLDCEVVAEGVETHEQVDVIVEAGCHLIQGYVYSKPKPLLTLYYD